MVYVLNISVVSTLWFWAGVSTIYSTIFATVYHLQRSKLGRLSEIMPRYEMSQVTTKPVFIFFPIRSDTNSAVQTQNFGWLETSDLGCREIVLPMYQKLGR